MRWRSFGRPFGDWGSHGFRNQFLWDLDFAVVVDRLDGEHQDPVEISSFPTSQKQIRQPLRIILPHQQSFMKRVKTEVVGWTRQCTGAIRKSAETKSVVKRTTFLRSSVSVPEALDPPGPVPPQSWLGTIGVTTTTVTSRTAFFHPLWIFLPHQHGVSKPFVERRTVLEEQCWCTLYL